MANMNGKDEVQGIPTDIIFRLRAKMDDNVFQEVHENGQVFLAFRIPGEKIDLLNSLEYLAEYLTPDSISEASKLLLISDQDYHVTDIMMIAPKLETKKKDDEKLFNELKVSLKEPLEPLVFTTENDILELYRIAIKVEGSHSRPDTSLGLDLLKVELPEQGEIVYLIFDDGFRKMSRSEFERLVDDSLSSLRQGPSLMKDHRPNSLSKRRQMTLDRSKIHEESGSMEKSQSAQEKRPVDRMTADTAGYPDDMPAKGRKVANDPKVLLRELARGLSGMGYRKDTKFSRSDVNQLFLIGMKGPAIFFKYMSDPDEMDSFLRVLDHRKDALGILVTNTWDPGIEAISRIRGFIYLDRKRASRTPDVIRAVIEEGGGS